MASATLLQKVAAHETSLTRKRDEAQEEARKIVEAAHAAAAARVQESLSSLDAEIADQRRTAAQAREQERQATERECHQKVARIRQESESRLAAVREELLVQVLPR